MKKFLLLVAGMLFLLGMSQVVSAQTATMYTLDNIYYYLVDGTTATEGGHDLEPPSGAVPGDTRFKTLSQIYQDTKAEFDQCDATAADVAEGKVFFCAETGSWGVQTGTASSGGGTICTGQTSSYVTGDDGYYEKGAARDYTDNGDTTTDNVTGLMWAKDGSGAGCNSGSTINWTSAISWAEGLTFASYSDWRLPNSIEIMTLMVEDAGLTAPYIDHTFFPNTVSGSYWSSTSSPTNTDYALCALFSSGLLSRYNKTNVYYVRAVRGGE